MTVFAEQLGVLFGILPAVATGFDVMKVEIYMVTTDFAFCSTFCLYFSFDFAPCLIVFGIAKPDIIG